ncbi:NAD(P)/FAD-dependent oxidoreductase [Trueperella pyogenes]|uniref:NAD(P)/FAD-dependent oxidoreductase n=1 Tax=Trueperella pyogenes TaxID=1661 RepID=UPI002168101A|nr:NAD(P)/FAD-dependent oxidoreductase [Trueperella pyogenes]UVJ55788.1 NAD(P)/FAD-dependent oxidoreductase [Trueperella pyogenes]
MNSSIHDVDVVVIGAGQAGLVAAHELQHRGVAGYAPASPPSHRAKASFVVLDAELGPGGAWRHRWDGLTMKTVNHIADLPGLSAPPADGTERASTFITDYFARYEDAFDLPILRPVRVDSVHDGGDRLLLVTSAGNYRARFVVNCTGTWDAPFIPWYPGRDRFSGIQIHTRDYKGSDLFWRKRTLVVGGGISAIDHIDEVSRVTTELFWATRTPPRWRSKDDFTVGQAAGGLTAEAGRKIEAQVRARTQAGLRLRPVVAETGLPRSERVTRMEKRGLLKRRPMFDRMDGHGVWWAQDSLELDAIIWATGFRPNLRHLAPLHLHDRGGGIVMDGIRVAKQPNVYLLGYGTSASTVGARRDARIAIREIIRQL